MLSRFYLVSILLTLHLHASDHTLNGKELLQKSGCLGCHSINGSKVIGPTLKGIYNRKGIVTINNDVKIITVDEDYIRNSIINPQAAIVDGYSMKMPSFKNKLKEEEINAIIKYLKELK